MRLIVRLPRWVSAAPVASGVLAGVDDPGGLPGLVTDIERA